MCVWNLLDSFLFRFGNANFYFVIINSDEQTPTLIPLVDKRDYILEMYVLNRIGTQRNVI